MMEELTHPVELFDEQLDLVAAGWNNCGCGEREGSFINVSDNNVAVLNNISVLSALSPQTVKQS